jgi:hypothetical protein
MSWISASVHSSPGAAALGGTTEVGVALPVPVPAAGEPPDAAEPLPPMIGAGTLWLDAGAGLVEEASAAVRRPAGSDLPEPPHIDTSSRTGTTRTPNTTARRRQ